MASNIVLKAIGLNLQPNSLDQQSTPPGSLLEASNVIVKRDNVVEPRRGYPLYGTSMGTSSDRAKQLMTYKGRILRHYSNKLQYDTLVQNANGESIFNTFCGNYLEPQTGRRIRFIEANGNFYFTTSEGVKKISAKTAADFTTACPFITQAGGIKAIDLTSQLSITLGNETGFLPQDSAVAYRVVWGSTDANGNEILGAPSQRSIIYNPMLNLELLDFNNLLLQLDNVGNNAVNPSLISDTDYFSSLNLPITASAFDLNTNLIALGVKLDNDILYADDVSAPLQISGASINSSIATISFDSGNPSDYFTSGSNIRLTGFTPTTGTLDGAQVVSTIVPAFSTTGDTNAGVQESTQIIVNNPDVNGNNNGIYFTINSANDINQYYVWLNVDNGGTDPMVPGRTGIRVNIATNAATTAIAAAIGQAFNGFASDFGSSVVSSTITVQNSSVGSATDATAGTTGYLVTTPVQGVDANIITTVASTAGIQVGTLISGTGIPANTYVTSIGVGTITISNNATATNSGVTLTFDSAINFNTSATGPVTFLNEIINSNEYEIIPLPISPSTPATHDQLQSLQDYMQAIITQLQSEPDTGSPPTISSNSQTLFITPIQLTTTANVLLTISIPSGVTTDNFFQIYRSSIAQATGTQVLATDIFPNDELKLVYEAFPTSAEITAGQIIVLDVTPPEFAGAFLYTNATTGEGILQANDVPPFALDINRYKNVLFYANTRTRFSQLINLLGVTNIIANFNSGGNPSFTITDGITTQTFTFVTGLQEITKITTVAESAGNYLNAGVGRYFTLNSANDFHQYYFYYIVSGVGTNPAISGKTGVPIYINAGDSASTVASKTDNVISSLALDFVNTAYPITNISAANPTHITSASHGLTNGQTINITGSNSSPSIDGARVITFIDANTFSVPVNVTIAGNTGTFTTTNPLTISTVDVGFTTDATAGNSPNTITIRQQGRGANAAAKEILLSTNVSPAQAVDETARSIVNIVNAQANGLVNAFYLSDASAVPGQIQFEARSLGQSPFYILANNSAVGSSFNPDISPTINISTISAANPTVITTSTPHGLINGDMVVISGSNSTPSVDGLYTITYISTTSFSIPVNVTISGNTGALKNASTTLISTNLGQVNRIYYSKILQPEAVPIVNFLDVGARDKAILRIFPLRDSLFVYKEDGLYRISGETAPFNLALFDLSCILLAPDSLDSSNNLLYGWTTQGIVSTSESGVNIISRPIDIDILKLATEQYVNFKSATWGIGYESDNSYTAYTVQEVDDVYATIGYRYSTLTNTWTTFAKTDTCGVINSVNDRQYLGSGDTNFLEQERKNFNRLDYADREYTQQVGGGNFFGTQLQIQNISLASVGDVITQTQYMTVYNYNSLLARLDTDLDLNHNYVSTLEIATGVNPRDKLDLLLAKLATDSVRIVQPGALPGSSYTKYESILGSFTITGISASDPTVITSTAHGLTTGRQITITGSNSTPSIDGTYQVTVLTANTFTIPVDVLTVGTTASYSVNNDNFLDIQASFNGMIMTLNSDPGVQLGNYMPITNSTLQEAIITAVSLTTNRITLNLDLQWLQGPITLFKAIPSSFQYSPQDMADPLSFKHFRESLLFFENKAFSGAILSFASDLLPAFIDVDFMGTSNGIFGFNNFGFNFFGGASHAAPFRTYVPRDVQRCRFLNLKFEHSTAREKYSLFGIVVVGENTQSSRAYR